MKIVIDARTMGSKPSGIGIYTFNYLKELAKTEHKLILLTDVETSEEMEYMRRKGIEIISYGKIVYRSAQVFKYFVFVQKELCKIQPDIFWEPNVLIPGMLSGFKGKVMITIHDMFPVTHVKFFGWKYGGYFRLLLRWTIQKADIVLYDSAETKEEAERYLPRLRTKNNYILYVIAPVLEALNASNQCDIGSEVKDQEYFLYVGNMEKRKGVDLLLDAYIKYRKAGGAKALILAGKSREDDIDKKISDLTNNYNNVFYYGYVSDEEKQWLYRNCSCFIFPSMAEGFGICVLEAMNYYKPIIASDLSIFKEIVGESINYFPLAGGRAAQIDNLSKKMLGDYQTPNQRDYDKVIARYLPERLGRQVNGIINEVR